MLDLHKESQTLINAYKESNKENPEAIALLNKNFGPFSGADAIISFAINNKDFANFCAEKKFNAFWESYLLSDQYCLDKSKNIFLKPQPPIETFQLILGYRLFRRYEEKKTHDLLTKSKACDCFIAMQLINQHLLAFYLRQPSEETMGILQNEINLISQKHGTPGFIEGALAFLEIGKHFSTTNQEQASASFYYALSYAYAAIFSTDHSRESIHNNHRGDNISPSDIEAILDTILEYLVEVADTKKPKTAESLKQLCRERALTEAEKLTHQYLTNYKTVMSFTL